MKKQYYLFIIIFNLLSTMVWGEDFLVNYYHKGVVVHSQQVAPGTPIGTLHELNLASCDDEINIFVGWITEDDVTKYQTSNTTTPTFITEEYVPTTNISLYAVFADGIDSGELIWQRIKSNSELKDNDQIIITAHNFNYAIGKTIDNKHLTAIEITKSDDKSTIIPNNDAQIFTLKKINDLLWGINNGNGYLANTEKKEAISTISEIKTWSSWSFHFNETNSVEILNEYKDCYRHLSFNESYHFFACKQSSTANLSIYKQTTATTINYIVCTTPDAVEYTITLHDGDNTSEIKCMSDASIAQPTSIQTAKHWEFYGWATAPINSTTTTPEIVKFPYIPTSNIDLYAVYSNTTADSLSITNKTIPAGWNVNETRAYNTVITLYAQNSIFIPKIENITTIEIEMMYTNRDIERTLYVSNQAGERLFIQKAPFEYNTYQLSFKNPASTELNITSSSTTYKDGIAIRKITIYHQPVYSSKIEEDIRHTITFDSQSKSDPIKHYSISQSHGKCIKLPKNTFSNDLDFIGWNSSPDGNGTAYSDETTIYNISNDITLYAQWGRIEIVESKEILNIDENNTINKLTIKSDIDGNTGEIKINNDAQLIIKDEIIFEKDIDNTRYHFFSLPFDCNITDIEAINNSGEKLMYAPNSTDGEWVICHYDQIVAANNAGDTTANAWAEILDKDYKLKANQGYIVGYFIEDEKVTLKFTSKEQQIISAPKDKTLDLGTEYQWYTDGEKLSANGWNLIGSPYYEIMTDGELTQFVTIPNTDGKTYTQCLYSTALKQRLITPFSAFFVQLKENIAPIITTKSPDYLTLNNDNSDIITLTITNEANKSDITTIINHSECSAEYEIGNDLKKWIGHAELPQIYTIENETPLAFNSQKIDETTTLSLGIYSPSEGNYTFSANENCPNIYLFDKETKTTVNLAQSDYTTQLSPGTNNNRFEISFQKTTSTQLPHHSARIEYFLQNGILHISNILQNAIIYIYDCTGKMIDITTSNHYTLPSKGLYHIVIIENDIKFDNFDVIY